MFLPLVAVHFDEEQQQQKGRDMEKIYKIRSRNMLKNG